jgi:hypothetical protein
LAQLLRCFASLSFDVLNLGVLGSLVQFLHTSLPKLSSGEVRYQSKKEQIPAQVKVGARPPLSSAVAPLRAPSPFLVLTGHLTSARYFVLSAVAPKSLRPYSVWGLCPHLLPVLRSQASYKVRLMQAGVALRQLFVTAELFVGLIGREPKPPHFHRSSELRPWLASFCPSQRDKTVPYRALTFVRLGPNFRLMPWHSLDLDFPSVLGFSTSC